MFTEAPQPFLSRAVAAAPLPRLLAVGPHCSRCLCSQLLSDQAISPPTPERWALMFERSPVPTPTLSSVTSTKHMQGRWIPLVFPVSWHLLVPPSTYLSVGAGREELHYHTASADSGPERLRCCPVISLCEFMMWSMCTCILENLRTHVPWKHFSDSERSIIITCQKYVMKAEGNAACLHMLNPMRNSSSQGIAVPI